MKTQSVLIIVLLLNINIIGCLGEEGISEQGDQIMYPEIWDRHPLEWNTTGTYSLVLEPWP